MNTGMDIFKIPYAIKIRGEIDVPTEQLSYCRAQSEYHRMTRLVYSVIINRIITPLSPQKPGTSSQQAL